MKIEVNKKYINAKGEVIFIDSKSSSIFGLSVYNIFYTKNYDRYFENGKSFTGNFEEYKEGSPFDLICLVDNDLLNQYEIEEITQKEFIQKHIELYTGMKFKALNNKSCQNCKYYIDTSFLLNKFTCSNIKFCVNYNMWELKE